MFGELQVAPGRAGSGMCEGDFQVRQRQQFRDPLRPFDQTDRVVAEVFGKSRRFPFAWIGEPIKIKVIEV